MSLLRKAVFGVGGAGIVGGGVGAWYYRKRLSDNRAVAAEHVNEKLKVETPYLLQNALSCALEGTMMQRQQEVTNSSTEKKMNDAAIQLFRYTTCPFCGRVKAFLDYLQIAHECVEVEPMFKGELKCSVYQKVPQLRLTAAACPASENENGSSPVQKGWLVDSELILKELSDVLQKMDLKTALKNKESNEKDVNTVVHTIKNKVTAYQQQLQNMDLKKEIDEHNKWAETNLVKILVLNVNSSLSEAWMGYDYIDAFDTIPFANKIFLKVLGAPVMYLVSEYKTKPTLERCGIYKRGDDVKQLLHNDLIKHWGRDALQGGKKEFQGGDYPSLADIVTYGTLQSVRGHKIYNELYAAATGGNGMDVIVQWLDRMDVATGKLAYSSKL